MAWTVVSNYSDNHNDYQFDLLPELNAPLRDDQYNTEFVTFKDVRREDSNL